jgi:biotin transport system substrate-specific component
MPIGPCRLHLINSVKYTREFFMQALLRKEIVLDNAVSRFAAIVVFTTLTAISGFVRIPVPMSPVPVTLQTFFVLLAGASLGGWRGGISQLGYLALGVCGLPVFSTIGSGFLYLTGPGGGYMAGFVFAALFIGFMRRFAGASYVRLFVLFVVADALILWSGIAWLKVLTGYDLGKLVQVGVLPFIPGDLLKAAGAAAVYKAIRSRYYC